jgi:hypothetical protein
MAGLEVQPQAVKLADLDLGCLDQATIVREVDGLVIAVLLGFFPGHVAPDVLGSRRVAQDLSDVEFVSLLSDGCVEPCPASQHGCDEGLPFGNPLAASGGIERHLHDVRCRFADQAGHQLALCLLREVAVGTDPQPERQLVAGGHSIDLRPLDAHHRAAVEFVHEGREALGHDRAHPQHSFGTESDGPRELNSYLSPEAAGPSVGQHEVRVLHLKLHYSSSTDSLGLVASISAFSPLHLSELAYLLINKKYASPLRVCLSKLTKARAYEKLLKSLGLF